MTEKNLTEQEKVEELEKVLEDEGAESNALTKTATKPGLDVKEGQYRVLGVVSDSPIYSRNGKGNNITQSCGYHVEEIATGRRIIMTKKEGVHLTAKNGMRNAYITSRKRVATDENGEVIKEWLVMYLQPYPARAESFTQDNRLVSVYRLDEDGKISTPIELLIKEEECTPEFWLMIQERYKKKLKKSKKSRNGNREAERELQRRLMHLEAEIREMDVPNPFNYYDTDDK